MPNLDAAQFLAGAAGVELGREFGKAGQVVYPKAHLKLVLARELPRQAPTHADIAVVIDNVAENIPMRAWLHAALMLL